jgi:beta-glucosidase
MEDIKDTSHNNPTDFDSIQAPTFNAPLTMKFRDLLPAETPATTYEAIVSYDDERWDTFLDQCNVAEMKELVDVCGYQTAAMASVGVPLTYEYDGPTGYVNFANKGAVYDVAYYCCEPVIASTWNADLVEEFGEVMGEEGIWGNAASGSGMPYTGIYAPGANIHRSPFGGRNGEYFSEDGLLSGKLAAAEVRGLQKKGVFAAVKHFAANEQETHRASNGDCSWLTEQALREIYLKPFEIAVKEGKARAIMSSFNRIGTRWTGGDYRLLTEILRNEWGFQGLVISDFNTCSHMVTKQMAYAGGDIDLATVPKSWCDTNNAADLYILRQNVKNVLYVLINSNAMNGDVIGYKLANWQVLEIAIDCVAAVALGIWAVFVFKKEKE